MVSKVFLLNKKSESFDNISIKYCIFASTNFINERFNRQLLSKPGI